MNELIKSLFKLHVRVKRIKLCLTDEHRWIVQYKYGIIPIWFDILNYWSCDNSYSRKCFGNSEEAIEFAKKLKSNKDVNDYNKKLDEEREKYLAKKKEFKLNGIIKIL